PLATHRFHLSGGRRGARVRRRDGSARAPHGFGSHFAADRAARHRSLLQSVRVRGRRPVVHPHHRERGDDGEFAPNHRDPVAVLFLWGLLPARVLDRGGHLVPVCLVVSSVRLCRILTTRPVPTWWSA